ncbi:uncharacterized protein Cortactin isoform X1 [Lepeophtheirus salmonis]|uniref:uncharacterized protein Cortactin isoform X1 n=2 Tax=Lepeophtheirus salmonis TaxID=72036 RepID=UPI001AE27DF1|nr:src substrate protein p85-like isoform X1 [Lepeophtheirus salmonis]
MIQLGAPDDDDWETDPDYVNDLTEEERRYGGRRNCEAIDMNEIHESVVKKANEDAKAKAVLINGSQGYGGKFGIEKDRMDASAMGHDYEGKVEKHASQTDYAKGFGGKHGVMKDRQDKSAVGWDHIEKVEKHDSQKDYKVGFGGKFGVQKDRVDKSAMDWSHVENLNKHQSQTDYKGGFGGKFGIQSDRVDKSAVGWEHVEKVEKHQSQKDYKTGFGGQFGVQKDRVDKSAVGWEHMENLNKHESQVDYAKGFGGKYGIQTDRVDKNAHTFEDTPEVVGTTYTKDKPQVPTRQAKNLREMFEKGGGGASNREEEFKAQKEKRKEQEALEVRAESRRIQDQKNTIDNDAAKQHEKSVNNKDNLNEAQSVTSKGKALSFRQKFENNSMGQTKSSSNSFAEERRKELEQIKLMKSENQMSKEEESSNSIDNVRKKLEISQGATSNVRERFENNTKIMGTSITNKNPEENHTPVIMNSITKKKLEEHHTSSLNTASITNELEEQTPPVIDHKVQPEKVTDSTPQQQVLHSEQETPTDNCYKAEVVTTQGIDENSGGGRNGSLSAIARYDYQAAADDEISFLPDDIILNIEKVDEGWWLGECHGKYGLFPANYVEII